MKFVSFALCFLLMCVSLSQKSIAGNGDTKSRHKIPVLDKEKQYPIKSFEPEAEEIYICLETKKDVLLDNDAHIYYVSDKRILITNALKGDVFIFDMNGKVLSHFNQKGGYGYTWLSYALYDEPNKEVFIADEISRKIFVFTEEGSLKRTHRLPLTTKITEIYNFDENTLLAFHEHQEGILTHDLKKSRNRAEANEKQDGTDARIRNLVYEFKTGQFFELEKRKYWTEKADVPANTSVELMQPYLLKIWLERGYLKGELKEIARKVNVTDNPVVKIARFK